MDYLNILFWNINKKDACDDVANLAHYYNTDIVVLIEDNNDPAKMLTALNRISVKYHFCDTNVRNISIYTSFDSSLFEKISTSSNFISFIRLKFLKKEILFGGIHLPSKLRGQNVNIAINEIKKDIKTLEKNHYNTVLVGDFNMNPFDDKMVEAEAFNAAMCRDIASINYRNVSGIGTGGSNKYMYFYNPMWSFLGDISKYTPGTYYYYGDQEDNNFKWNMLDQILIRPCLIPTFVEDSLIIIDRDLSGNVLINSRAKSRSKSQKFDHLPITFSLDLTK